MMAARVFSTICFFSLCFLCSLVENGFALQGKKALKTHASKHTPFVQVSSLIPSSICSPSKVANPHKSALKVVHKYGPCSNLHKDQMNLTDLTEKILRRDQLRVKSIRAIFNTDPKKSEDDKRFQQTDATTLPANDGSLLNSGNYYVSVGLGTPSKDMYLAFDTGSDLTWTQCKPCEIHCYDQKQEIFDPSASSSYANEPCDSDYCSSFGSRSVCSSGKCMYHVGYGDNSYTEGYLSKDTLTLTKSDTIDGFLFGCGQNNDGLFNGIAGLLGLGRGKTSIVKQASQKYNGLFSYCLPTTSSSTGHLNFGDATSNNAVQYTPLLTLSTSDSFYGIQLSAITVDGVTVKVPPSPSAIIDSGTVITRLPSAVYSALKSEFQKHFGQYPQVAGTGPLDTCYDISGAAEGSVPNPSISLSFGGGAKVELRRENKVLMTGPSQMCLAFAGEDGDLTILGNVQQKGFEVVYDIGRARIGFSSSVAC